MHQWAIWECVNSWKHTESHVWSKWISLWTWHIWDSLSAQSSRSFYDQPILLIDFYSIAIQAWIFDGNAPLTNYSKERHHALQGFAQLPLGSCITWGSFVMTHLGSSCQSQGEHTCHLNWGGPRRFPSRPVDPKLNALLLLSPLLHWQVICLTFQDATKYIYVYICFAQICSLLHGAFIVMCS